MSFFFEIISNTPDISIITFFILCIISLFTSAVSATFGLGGGSMLIAVLVNILNPIAVIPIHAVIQLNSNFFRALIMWRNIQFNGMVPFFFGNLIGLSVGGQIAFNIPGYLLQGIIGIFILYSIWGSGLNKISNKSSKASFLVGIITSFTTMFVGGTGALLGPYIKRITNERRITVATHGAYMSLQHLSLIHI